MDKAKVLSRYPEATLERLPSGVMCVWDMSREQRKERKTVRALLGLSDTAAGAWLEAVRTIEKRELRKLQPDPEPQDVHRP